MKRLIQISLLIVGIALLTSCKKEEMQTNIRLCDNQHFLYSSDGSKAYFKQSLSEIGIVFEQDEVTMELAKSILSKYSFLNFNVLTNNYSRIQVGINENVVDCAKIKDYLMVLNNDDEIFSATPIFYTSENDPDSNFMLLAEVLTKNDEKIISESDFVNFAETMNLELINAEHGTQHFKVKEVKTGFESLEIANQRYESGKVKYAEPNMVIKIINH